MPASYPLSPADAARLQKWFAEQSWSEKFDKPWTLFAYRVRGESLAWSYYPKKKVLVEEGKPGAMGAAAREAMGAFFPGLAPNDGVAEPKVTETRTPDAYPYAGSDESGKGDTFGPLAVAGCRLDKRTEELLRTLDVRDSKLIGDKEILALAETIRQAIPGNFAVRSLEPRAYNQAIADVRMNGGNLNTLLGRLHGECITELAGAGPIAWAIVDQFGDAKYLKRELPPKLPFRTETRAEAYAAVAAASILAREACLRWFEREAAKGNHWPRGSSDPRILSLLREVTRTEGPAGVRRVAKEHFASVQRILDEA